MTRDIEDVIEAAASDGEDLYRVGTPSIGETFGRRWNASRDSGGLGTGVYAFTEREAAESNIEETSPGRELVVLENALSNPIRPGDFQTTVDLNDLSREAARAAERVRMDTSTVAEEKEDPTRRMSRKARSVLFDTPELRDPFGFDTDAFVAAWVDAAVAADRARDSAFSTTATQPINHLLHPDFDGVYPRGEAGRSGTYGAVIFKEKVDDCVGRVTEEGEQIDASVLNDCFS